MLQVFHCLIFASNCGEHSLSLFLSKPQSLWRAHIRRTKLREESFIDAGLPSYALVQCLTCFLERRLETLSLKKCFLLQENEFSWKLEVGFWIWSSSRNHTVLWLNDFLQQTLLKNQMNVFRSSYCLVGKVLLLPRVDWISSLVRTWFGVSHYLKSWLSSYTLGLSWLPALQPILLKLSTHSKKYHNNGLWSFFLQDTVCTLFWIRWRPAEIGPAGLMPVDLFL